MLEDINDLHASNCFSASRYTQAVSVLDNGAHGLNVFPFSCFVSRQGDVTIDVNDKVVPMLHQHEHIKSYMLSELEKISDTLRYTENTLTTVQTLAESLYKLNDEMRHKFVEYNTIIESTK